MKLKWLEVCKFLIESTGLKFSSFFCLRARGGSWLNSRWKLNFDRRLALPLPEPAVVPVSWEIFICIFHFNYSAIYSNWISTRNKCYKNHCLLSTIIVIFFSLSGTYSIFSKSDRTSMNTSKKSFVTTSKCILMFGCVAIFLVFGLNFIVAFTLQS